MQKYTYCMPNISQYINVQNHCLGYAADLVKWTDLQNCELSLSAYNFSCICSYINTFFCVINMKTSLIIWTNSTSKKCRVSWEIKCKSTSVYICPGISWTRYLLYIYPQCFIILLCAIIIGIVSDIIFSELFLVCFWDSVITSSIFIRSFK